MNTKKRKQQVNVKKIIIILIIVVLVLFAAFLGLRYLKSVISQRFASNDTSTVESAEVTTGSISTTVYGTGTLANEDSETISLPSTVEVTKLYVSKGDVMKDGDLLASVNASTVLQAMAEKQEEIDELDEELADISADTIDENVKTNVAGRVKQIYAAVGDDVTEVMVENNALLTLSIDGYMAVSLKDTTLQRAASVTVTLEDDTAYTGTVSSTAGDTAVILITDNGPAVGASCTVTDSEGTEVGTGTLYIHEPVSIMGFAGTVETIKVTENQAVKANATLMTLTDVSYSANYATLLSERAELEEELLDLLTIYREGGVYAHAEGTITAVSKGSYSTSSSGSFTSSGSSSSSSGASISYCSNDMMELTISVDETDILSLTVGQEATVYISSLSEDAYEGTVTEVGTTGTSSNGVTSYSATVQVKKEDGMLSGMSATAYVTIEGTDNALLIPVDALNETSTTAYVYTTYDEENDTLGGMVEVEIGLQNSKYVEIKSGLSEGDTVYYKESTTDNQNKGGFGGFGGGGMNNPGGSDFNFSDFTGGGSSNIPSGNGGGSSFPSGNGGGSSNFPSGNGGGRSK